jgi:hypothetical protein
MKIISISSRPNAGMSIVSVCVLCSPFQFSFVLGNQLNQSFITVFSSWP